MNPSYLFVVVVVAVIITLEGGGGGGCKANLLARTSSMICSSRNYPYILDWGLEFPEGWGVL